MASKFHVGSSCLPAALTVAFLCLFGTSSFAQTEQKSTGKTLFDEVARHDADRKFEALMTEIRETGTFPGLADKEAAIRARREERRLEMLSKRSALAARTRPDADFAVVRQAAPTLATKTIIVNTALDDPDLSPGDGTCHDGFYLDLGTSIPECTLRAAIEEANATAGTDSVIILFDLLTTDRGGITTANFGYVDSLDVWRIAVNWDDDGALPAITRQNVHLDGTFQKDGSGIGDFDDAYCGDVFFGDTSRVKVMIDGTAMVSGDILTISASDVSVYGLAISNGPSDGIVASGANDLDLY